MKSPYRKSIKIIDCRYLSWYVYWMLPKTFEKKHYHDGVEFEYVIKGNCKTHKQGHFYFRKKRSVHEGINDSTNELIFMCLTIPAESTENTHFV